MLILKLRQIGNNVNRTGKKTLPNIGICYAKTGRRAQAIKALDTAIELDPSYEPAILNRMVIEQLNDGESLKSGGVGIIDYTREYRLEGKNLLSGLV